MKLIDADDVIAYIDTLSNSGLGKKKALEYLKKYICVMSVEVARCTTSVTQTGGNNTFIDNAGTVNIDMR